MAPVLKAKLPASAAQARNGRSKNRRQRGAVNNFANSFANSFANGFLGISGR
jgi:hypothetical protein